MVARNPRSTGALFGLARIAADEGDTLTALVLADSTLHLNPNHAQAGWLRRELMRGARP